MGYIIILGPMYAALSVLFILPYVIASVIIVFVLKLFGSKKILNYVFGLLLSLVAAILIYNPALKTPVTSFFVGVVFVCHIVFYCLFLAYVILKKKSVSGFYGVYNIKAHSIFILLLTLVAVSYYSLNFLTVAKLDFLVDRPNKAKFYLQRASDFNDVSFCAMADNEYIFTGLGSEDNDCFFQFARRNKDADSCLRSRSANYCLDSVLSLKNSIDPVADMKYCDAMINTENADLSAERRMRDKSHCIFLLARKAGDYKICEKISDQVIRDECYVYGSNNLKDTGLCSKVEDKQKQKACGFDANVPKQTDNSQAPYYDDALSVYFEGDIKKQQQEEDKNISLLYGVAGSDWTFQNKTTIPCRITDAYECEKINIKLKDGTSRDIIFKVFDESLCTSVANSSTIQWPYCQIVKNLKNSAVN